MNTLWCSSFDVAKIHRELKFWWQYLAALYYGPVKYDTTWPKFARSKMIVGIFWIFQFSVLFGVSGEPNHSS